VVFKEGARSVGAASKKKGVSRPGRIAVRKPPQPIRVKPQRRKGYRRRWPGRREKCATKTEAKGGWLKGELSDGTLTTLPKRTDRCRFAIAVAGRRKYSSGWGSAGGITKKKDQAGAGKGKTTVAAQGRRKKGTRSGRRKGNASPKRRAHHVASKRGNLAYSSSKGKSTNPPPLVY